MLGYTIHMSLVQNKKVHMHYEVKETFEAGMELRGFEVKNLAAKQGSLEGARILVRGGEVFMVGSYIPAYQLANTPASYDPYRTRRLLMNKKEIEYLATSLVGTGLQIVAVSIYTKKKIKIQIALARKRNKADAREYLKEKDDKKMMRQVE
jgi:SsrA-binding protein